MTDNKLVDEGEHSINNIRSNQRELSKLFRKRKKDGMLKQHREDLQEVEEFYKYISVNEMSALALDLKKSKNPSKLLHQIKNAACFSEEHIEAFLRVDGALFSIVGILCGRNSNDQLEAAACLTNFAAGSHKSSLKIAKTVGAYLITFMASGSPYLQGQCAWTAGNIVNDCEKCFCILKSQGLLAVLEPLLKSPSIEVIQSAVFAIHACTQYSLSLDEQMQTNLTKSLGEVINSDITHEVKAEALFSLSNICYKVIEQSEHLYLLMSTAFLNTVRFITSNEELDRSLYTACIRCLGNLTAASDSFCESLATEEVFNPFILKIMHCQYHHLKKETLWLLSNIIVSVGASQTVIDWLPVVNTIEAFLTPLDLGVIQALYLLSLIAASELRAVLETSNTLSHKISHLRSCNVENIQTAANTLYCILNQNK